MAKALILLFSQCGHTKVLAERIAAKLKTAGMNSDLIDITEGKPDNVSDYKIVFIGSPVYYYKEPLLWKNYIKSLPDLSGKAGFIFSTFGDAKGKQPAKIMNDNLSLYFQERGIKILSFEGTVCEDTWTPHKKRGKSGERPNGEDLKDFDAYIEKILNEYKNGKIDRAIYDYSLKQRKHRFGNLFWSLFTKICPKPRIDNHKCIKCGECVRRCPVGNIELNGGIRIKSGCIKCYECERVCGKKGIKVNWKLYDTLHI